MSDLDPLRSMHRPVKVAHSLFIEGSHTTKNTASGVVIVTYDCQNIFIVEATRGRILFGGGCFVKG